MTQFSCLESSIELGPLVESTLPKLLTKTFGSSKKVILVDSSTNEQCLPLLFTHLDGLENAEIIEIPAGEENKTMEICFSIWEALSEMEFGRNDLLICLGGGMICDLGGFMASIYKRGMNCVYIPTSLLAMVDASIGGKTGVDLGSFKNQLGTFAEPSHVFIDASFLQTLPEKERLNGLAEMLKHGLIADAEHFEKLGTLSLENITRELIVESLQIKTKIVESDPKEKNQRKLLNFGHTVGHAIEGLFLNSDQKIDHGLAVAHGILVEAKISVIKGLLSVKDFERIENTIKERFPLQCFSEEENNKFISLMLQDKKRSKGSRFTLLKGIGQAVFDVKVKDEVVFEALKVLQ